MWDRTNFYSDEALSIIPSMFEKFDDESVYNFIEVIKNNIDIQNRIRNRDKFGRLKSLGEIVLQRVSIRFKERSFLGNIG